jgi:hypothetical protein
LGRPGHAWSNTEAGISLFSFRRLPGGLGDILVSVAEENDFRASNCARASVGRPRKPSRGARPGAGALAITIAEPCTPAPRRQSAGVTRPAGAHRGR